MLSVELISKSFQGYEVSDQCFWFEFNGFYSRTQLGEMQEWINLKNNTKNDDQVSSKEISWETLDKCVESLPLLLYSELVFVTLWMKQWQNIMQFHSEGTSQGISKEREDSKVKYPPLRAGSAVSSTGCLWLCHGLFQQDPFFGVCKKGHRSLNQGVWSIHLSSVLRVRSPSHLLNTSQILFQTECFPCLVEGCLSPWCLSAWCMLTIYPFHAPASTGCGVKSISYMKDTDTEKWNDLCGSMQEVCNKVGKNATTAVLTLASTRALQKGAVTLRGVVLKAWHPD